MSPSTLLVPEVAVYNNVHIIYIYFMKLHILQFELFLTRKLSASGVDRKAANLKSRLWATSSKELIMGNHFGLIR